MGQARAVPHSHSKLRQMHYVIPPTTGTFPNTLQQTQHAAEGEQSLPAARVPKSKIHATASVHEARQRQGDFARRIQNNQMGQFSCRATEA